MTNPIPPLQLDTHREKASSGWNCIVKSACCSKVESDQDAQIVDIDVTATQTDDKVCCVAKDCCVIL